MAHVRESQAVRPLDPSSLPDDSSDGSNQRRKRVPILHLPGKRPERERFTPPQPARGRDLRFYGISLGMHAIVIIMIACAAHAPHPNPPVTIDFTISSAQPGASPHPPAPARVETAAKPKSVTPPPKQVVRPVPPATKPVEENNEKSLQETSPVAVAQTPKEIAPPVQTPEPASRDEGTTQTASGAPTGRSNGKSAGSAEVMRSRYLKEQFNYIRDKIASNVRYPRHARRMGWTGVTHVSFVIEENGTVSDVKVIKSSRVSLLDEEASESVRRSAPFPRPPVRARIVIPVEYIIG
jgi:protein TonB